LSEIEYRVLSPDDIEAGLRLCRLSRWNQLAGDWELFISLSPEGCYAAVTEDRVIGTMATVNYQERFAWVGMVLVDPEFRGRGIGTQLLHSSFEILKEVSPIRLDATPQGRPVYDKLGFVDEYALSRMQIEVTGNSLFKEDGSARRIVESDLAVVLDFDRFVFGANRGPILKWAWRQAPEYAWIVMGPSGVYGYCFGRHGFNFEQIGPVVAIDQQIAQKLVASCLAGQEGKRFILDPLHFCAEWLDWLLHSGFVHQRPFTRMFRGENRFPGIPTRQWAIYGPEFG
jgi:GNAT superfamily N-acetyltransferase